jgi:hypothetical protein
MELRQIIKNKASIKRKENKKKSKKTKILFYIKQTNPKAQEKPKTLSLLLRKRLIST